MKKPRKPKMSKYPKRPKQSASLQTWKNYERRCNEVDKRNREKVSAYNKKLGEIKQAKALRERLSKKGRTPKTYHLKVA